ncbi:DUF507 family protein [Helicobacter saguini]|uniref:DUF507 family protein n=1 Tax=Helicobacter saguini TaxID=1548018 RepID=A0A347VP16_9HELI|nr:DUF507 family protein [Helicobacter saguini]MWV61549.1 DUF507 family protein [Helicobacter saguini]MWV67781.1 DUF507 family protein [Helicobacter saguini]MWV70751.1 DUF507 family protein [Helicobacter saguini]MWV72655.1 DUF507 family protein [Helicobacter saguini]TLD94541.1 DUF507 family protein [Helicobacter saguini]
MKLKPLHAKFIATRIINDLSRSNYVKFNAPMPRLIALATQIIEDDIKEEYAIESKARELVEKHQDDIDDNEVDERQFFSMVKRQIAAERGFLLNKNERYSKLAHEILDGLFEEKYIEFNVPENVVKNHILDSIKAYLRQHENITDIVMDKMRNMQKKLIAGSEEYDLMFARLYEEEVGKLG